MMTINRATTTAIATLAGALLAAHLAVAAQHQHTPSAGSNSMETGKDQTAKGEKAIKVGKNGDVEFRVETIVGDLRLKPGRYEIQHRTEGSDHFVHFTEMSKRLPYGPGGTTAVAHPGDVKCRLEMLDHKVSGTAVYTRTEGGSTRVTKVLISGENVAHLF